MALRIPTAIVIRTFVAKGIKDPSERLQVLKVLDVISLLDPLETETRSTQDDANVEIFRTAIGGVLTVYGTELIIFMEEVCGE